MAGRGRGRGGGSSKFNPGDLGLSVDDFREVTSGCSGQSIENYPPLTNKPLTISEDDEIKYYVGVRQEFRDFWKSSPYYIRHDPVKADNIVRYRDQFANASTKNIVDNFQWKPDPNCFPKELHVLEVSKKRSRGKKSTSKKKAKFTKDLGKTLDNLQMKEGDDDNESNSGQDSDEDDDEDVNEPKDEDGLEEVEFEEGADYSMSYFDNGEDYLDNDEDGMDDGPTF